MFNQKDFSSTPQQNPAADKEQEQKSIFSLNYLNPLNHMTKLTFFQNKSLIKKVSNKMSCLFQFV
jgi:hypothetical protein